VGNLAIVDPGRDGLVLEFAESLDGIMLALDVRRVLDEHERPPPSVGIAAPGDKVAVRLAIALAILVRPAEEVAE
jgi:hypothetical protein